MGTRADKEDQLIQSAVKTVCFNFGTPIDESRAKLEQNTNNLIQYFHGQQLTVNTSKTEFMIFGKNKRKDFKEQIFINSIPINKKFEVKQMEAHIDSNLTFQGEVKYLLRRIAQGIKQFTLLENLSHKNFKRTVIKSFALPNSCHSRNWAESNGILEKTAKLRVYGEHILDKNLNLFRI